MQLQTAPEDYTFTCGAPLSDLELPEGINVHSRDITCGEPIEKLYYAANIPQFVCIVQKMSSGRKRITIHSVPTAEKNLELKKT